jgi:hypothetical protein
MRSRPNGRKLRLQTAKRRRLGHTQPRRHPVALKIGAVPGRANQKRRSLQRPTTSRLPLRILTALSILSILYVLYVVCVLYVPYLIRAF